MIKYLIILLPLLAAGCNKPVRDVHYYSTHPAELQEAIEDCPDTHPEGISCEQINDCATYANEMISEFHYNRQIFGQKILELQKSLHELSRELSQHRPHSYHLQENFDIKKMLLNERLAIVKWLESPRAP